MKWVFRHCKMCMWQLEVILYCVEHMCRLHSHHCHPSPSSMSVSHPQTPNQLVRRLWVTDTVTVIPPVCAAQSSITTYSPPSTCDLDALPLVHAHHSYNRHKQRGFQMPLLYGWHTFKISHIIDCLMCAETARGSRCYLHSKLAVTELEI